jgi:hypothetical protein
MSPLQAEFAARLSRIEDKAATRSVTFFVGQDETHVIERSPRRRAASRKGPSAMALPLAFTLGCLAYAAGLYARFRLDDSLPALDPQRDMLVSLLAGLCIVFLIGQMDGLDRSRLRFAKVVGVLVSALAFHNLVHVYPSTFAEVFSDQWVASVIETTSPASIAWQGRSIVF